MRKIILGVTFVAFVTFCFVSDCCIGYKLILLEDNGVAFVTFWEVDRAGVSFSSENLNFAVYYF